MAAFGLLAFALLLPVQANTFAQKVLGQVIIVNNAIGISAPVETASKAVSGVISKATDALVSTDTPGTPKDNSPMSQVNIIDATNKERVKAGLQPLKTNAKLAASAKIKADDMVKNQYFEHTSPAGKTVADLGDEVGYDYVVMGENLALGDFDSAAEVLDAWMNSPGHRANILNTSYQDIGVYAEQGTYQGRTVWFAVQHFGTERGVCPALSTVLKNNIDSLNAKIKSEEAQISALRKQIEDPNHAQDASYGNLITQFNDLVKVYNSDVQTSQTNISSYNKQVVAFNNCLNQYQVSKE
jgi:uncharacterized protein YkwD